MTRQAKLTAVPVEQKEEEVASGGDEVKTDAQAMTEIINEVKVDDAPVLTQEYVPVVEIAKPKAKARAKREPQKPVEQFTEPEVEVNASLDEAEADVTLPVEPKVESKASCPDCGKQMSAKTLRYSHGPNCTAKKQKHSEVDHSVIEEVIENEVQKRLHISRAHRAVRRREMVEKLMQNAF